MRFLILFFGLLLCLTSGVLVAQDFNPYWVRAVDWSSDGTLIAFGTQAGELKVFNVKTEDQILVLKDMTFIYTVAWKPDSTQLAIGTDNTTKIVDVASGQIIHALPMQREVRDLAWSPDGTELVTASVSAPNNVNIWDIATEQIVFSPSVGDTLSAAWSPDGTMLAISRFKEIQLWDVRKQEYIKTIDVSGDVLSIDWNTDGSQIASAEANSGEDAAVHIWDVSTGLLLKSFEDHTDYIWSVTWSPLGTTIASASVDHTVRVWDVNSGQLLELYQSEDRIFDVAFSPFGGRLAFGEAVSAPIFKTFLPHSIVRIVVPAPSLSLLNSIAAACAPDANLPPTDDLTAYIDSINNDASIPPACAADLIAVAEALEVEE